MRPGFEPAPTGLQRGYPWVLMVIGVGALATAYTAEYALGLEPCNLCLEIVQCSVELILGAPLTSQRKFMFCPPPQTHTPHTHTAPSWLATRISNFLV